MATGWKGFVRRLRSARPFIGLLAALVAAIAAIVSVVYLEHVADGARRDQVQLLNVEARVNELQGLPFAAPSTTRDDSNSAARMRVLSADIQRRLTVLSLGSGKARLRPVEQAWRADIRLLDRVRELVASNDIPLAQVTSEAASAEQRRLLAALDRSSDAYAQSSRSALKQAAVGSAAAILLLYAGFAVFYTRSRIARQQLATEARTDTLTGLLNRRGFDERILVELAHAKRQQYMIAVVAVDIDHFKQVNDEWGHDIGDQVLRRLGSILRRQSREIDVLARIGGEEFLVILPACDDYDAARFVSRIRTIIGQEEGDLPRIRVSAGIATAHAPETIEPLLRRADLALYAAKRGGRDQHVVASSEPSPRADVAATDHA